MHYNYRNFEILNAPPSIFGHSLSPICQLYSLLSAVFVAVEHFHYGAGQQLDKFNSGVIFRPYVKPRFMDSSRLESTYSAEEVQVMLEVVSARFLKVLTMGVHFDQDPLWKKHSVNGSTKTVCTAEVVAAINRNRTGNYIAVVVGDFTNIQRAFDCAQRANAIFPRTVLGILRSYKEYSQNTETRTYISSKENEFREQNIRLGGFLSSYDQYLMQGKKDDENGLSAFEIMDFIIWRIEIDDELKVQGPTAAFHAFAPNILIFQQYLRNISRRVELMIQTTWASEGKRRWENVESMKTFWETASGWGKHNNFSIWFDEALDTETSNRHRGWWKLTNASKSAHKDAYTEKVSELRKIEDAALDTGAFLGVSVGILGLVVLVAVIAVLVLRVKSIQQQLTEQDVRQFMDGVPSKRVGRGDRINDCRALQYPYDSSFEIEKQQLKIFHDKILGSGKFGFVFQAEVEKNPGELLDVALKVPRDDCARSGLKGFLSEIKILTYVGLHPHIVTFVGAYTAELHNNIVYIAIELCGLGSLHGYLRKHEEMCKVSALEIISLQQMIKWSQEIACGMNYLDTKNVVHADLAARNVLLSCDKTAKVSDFGLSRYMDGYSCYVKSEQGPLPWRWMAIESLKRLEFSVKSDVWSYGVTVWEIFTLGHMPYYGLAWTANFLTMLISGMRLGKPPHATQYVYSMMLECWHTDPSERPNFTNILDTLDDVTHA